MAFWMAATSVWAVLQLLLLSWPVRTVRWPTVLLAFGVGAYGCGVLSMALELVVARQLATAREKSLSGVMDVVSWTTAPVVEELIKIAPLLVAGWALRRRMQWGLADFVVLGGAAGAGFGLLEKLLMYAESAGKAVPTDDGGWQIAGGLFDPPYVPGLGQILGSWFPSSTGTVEVGGPALPYEVHIFASALGGLAVGLLWCGARVLTRIAALVPLAGAVAIHWVTNYAAAFPGDETAMEWRERLAGDWGLWIILGCLAVAWIWDLRRSRLGRRHQPDVVLAAERQGQAALEALLGYALLRLPATWIIALGYARQRRALLYAAAHPRSRPEKLEPLRESVAQQTHRMDATHSQEAWRGVTLRQLWRRAREQRPRRPRHEKVLLVLSLLLAVPSLLYMAVGSFPSTKDLQEYFTGGTGLRILVGVGLAGLALTLWRLISAVSGYRAASASPLGEAVALVQFRIAVCAGSLVVGVLLLSRWSAIADGEAPLAGYRILGTDRFLLEKLLETGLPLLLTLAMFAMPYALPLEVAMGGGLAETLLVGLAPRALAPVASRIGARLAAREATQWARGALRSRGRGFFSRTWDRVRHGRTDPVDVATGRMFLPQTDVELPGVLPLVFSRRVDSGYRAGRWFGPTWASTADQRLEFDEQGVVFFTEDGLLLAYPHPVPGGAAVLPAEGPRWPLARTADGGTYTLTEPDAGLVRTFTPYRDEALALLREITDRNGNRVTFTYDASGTPLEILHSGGYRLRLTSEHERITGLWVGDVRVRGYGYTDGHLTEVTGSSGLPLRFVYDRAGRVTSWIDTNNRWYSYAYDEHDRVTAEGGEGGHYTLRIGYDEVDPDFPGLKVTTLTSPDGAVTRYLIDEAHQVVGEIEGAGAVSRTMYDEAGRTVAETDPLGRTTGFRYDEHGHLTAVIRPDGSEIGAVLDAQGNLAQITDPGGAIWRQTFDAAGNRTTLTDPLAATTRHLYDERGGLLAVTDALGATTRVRCDAAGLPVEITDPLGATTCYQRDAFGRVVAETDPLGAVTRYEWSPEGNLLRRTGPDGSAESWTYDGEGNRTTHTDPVGGTTVYEYTHFDLLSARTGPDGVRYEFEHDAALRLTRVTNPQGLRWSYEYDLAGRLVAETDFDDREVRYAYDATGHLTARTDPLGRIITYEYDLLGRLIRKASVDRTTTFTYDPAGLLTSAADPDAEVVYQRDRLGRVTSEMVNGRVLTHSYDPLGRRTRRTTPTGAITTYAYDAAGNRTALTAGNHTLASAHDAAGRETTRRVGDALTLTHTWDPLGRLTTQSLTGASGNIHHRAYTYRADGHLIGVDDHRSGRRTFGLDAAGRVTTVHAHDWTETYAYDEAGNQTHAAWPSTQPAQEATGPRTYIGTRITGAGSIRYEHDAAGRLTLRQKTRLSKKPDTWRYTWDAEDRLVSVTTPAGTVWRYRYDPFGRRTTKQRLAADGETVLEQTDFTWDGPTLIEQTTTTPDVPHPVTLTWDHEGFHPVAQTERITEATTQREIDTRFFAIVTDLVGTPTELIDESGTIAWRTRSTLWGTTTWAADSTAYTPLRFPGQYFDPETGLHYNFHRYYDPDSARYLSPDPLGLSPAPNPATYTQNPHTWFDPLGLSPCPGGNHNWAGNPAEHARLKRFYEQAQKYGKAGFRELENGRFRFYGKITPAAKEGEIMGRRLVREWDPATDSTRIWHESLDHSGRVRITRPDVKFTGGKKVHYLFDDTGKLIGTF
ncbi:RHS repeat-associated core domain-containing protein [Streptomyces melanosporofaciens]|uniref:RHS repeat-associated core domain-containing protein n=2 Tax=Streptomyces melanosporofaciens TaxID=67327 RepID=A0A1H4U762_STRMJ|nr:RHS repeat-associated core domain-containing protein [Streptomyces melanosporofaciens]